MKENKKIILIGYSGHAFVICDIFEKNKQKVIGYCEFEEKNYNPYQLEFFGKDSSEEGIAALKANDYFIAIGSNKIRAKIQANINKHGLQAPINCIHPTAVIGSHVNISKGVLIAANATINPVVNIGEGAVINTSSIIEHEVNIGKYTFIAPNTTLLGGVQVGDYSFIGANAVVRQNVKIGKNVTIGAGAVILEDIPDGSTVVGNPQRFIK